MAWRLRHDASLDQVLPGVWQSAIRLLQEFTELEQTLRNQEVVASVDRGRLLQLHDAIVVESAKLLEPESLGSLSNETTRAIFSRSVLAACCLKECSLGTRPVLSTKQAVTLPAFLPDWQRNFGGFEAIRQSLLKILDNDQASLAQIEQQLSDDMGDARRKLAIVDAIRDHFELDSEGSDSRSGMERLIAAFVPGLEPIVKHCEVVIAGTLIFLCLPYEEKEWKVSESSRELSLVLDRINLFRQWQFSQFPVFGYLQGDRLDAKLIEAIAERAGLDRSIVKKEIGKTIALLPKGKAESYLVHDVWGHSWQASILQLEKQYEALARFADPITSSDTVHIDGNVVALWDCCAEHDGMWSVDLKKLRVFIDQSIMQKMPMAMTPVLAEMIADMAEYKVAEDSPELLPMLQNSSLIDTVSSKLDLVLNDLRFYFLQGTKSWRLLATSREWQSSLALDLQRRGVPVGSAKEIVRAIVSQWEELAQGRFAAELQWEEVAEGLQVNLYTRMALNLLGIHRSAVHSFAVASRWEVPAVAMRSLRDLVLVNALVFFEEDPVENLWRLDEYLAFRVLPLCEEFLSGISQRNR